MTIEDIELAAIALRTRVRWYESRRIRVPANLAVAFNNFADALSKPDRAPWKRIV